MNAISTLPRRLPPAPDSEPVLISIEEGLMYGHRMKVANLLLQHIQQAGWSSGETCMQLDIDHTTFEKLVSHDVSSISIETMLLWLFNCGLTVDYVASRCLGLEYSSVTASLLLDMEEQRLLMWRTFLQPLVTVDTFSAKELIVWMALSHMVKHHNLTISRMSQISWSSVFSHVARRPLAGMIAMSLVIDLRSNTAAIYGDPFRPGIGEEECIALPLRPFLQEFDLSSFAQM